MTYSNSQNEHRFKVWFPGLENEKPAVIIWYHHDVEEAYRQLVDEYPDCSIVGIPN